MQENDNLDEKMPVTEPSSGDNIESGEETDVSHAPQGQNLSSRAEERIKELTERIKVYEETLRALQQQQQPQPNPEPDDEILDPALKKVRNEVNMLKMALAQMYDLNDKLMVQQKYNDFNKYEPEIEAYLTNLRKQGQNLSREQVYLMIKAQKLLSQPKPTSKPKEEEKVNTPPPETKSSKKAVKQPTTLEDVRELLKDVKF